jgi:hypothetical protein
MIVSFDSLPDQSRIWIFSSTRVMDSAVQEQLLQSTLNFLTEWTAHNRALTASAQVVDGVFLVVSVDESTTGASGCSIDKLYRFVKEAESRLSVQLMDRLHVLFPGNPVSIAHSSKIQSMINAGELTGDSLVYNTSLTDLGQFRSNFRTPLQKTWLSRYL